MCGVCRTGLMYRA
ncbi:MAG TPA: hypothetical protein DDY28_05220 [Hyphomonas atlantica]|nr:hypothetical protein [Hyphomonas atlantica]